MFIRKAELFKEISTLKELSKGKDKTIEYLREQMEFYRTRFEFCAADNASLRMKNRNLEKRLNEKGLADK